MTTVHEFKRNNLYRIDTTDGEAFAVSVQIDDDELLELCRIIVGIERRSGKLKRTTSPLIISNQNQ